MGLLQTLLSTTLVMTLTGSCALVPAVMAADAPKEASVEPAAAARTETSSTFDEIQSKAFLLAMDGKHDEAQKLLEDAIKQEKDAKKRIGLYYLLSAVEHLDENYEKAIAHLQMVLNAQATPKTPADHLNRALILKRIGDCYYGTRNTTSALSNYKAALSECASLPPDSMVYQPLLEAITGTYVYAKKYTDAESTGKQLLAFTSERAKSDQLDDVAALFWARLQMLGIYRHLGKDEERKKLWAASAPLLDKLLAFRAQMDSTDRLQELESLRKDFEDRYITAFQPSSPAEYLWLAGEFKMRSLPLIQWPAKNGPAKASILCIHGLGLENRAFKPFGHAMAERGYSVYALDVRGFGAWQTTAGQEDVQFSETLKDIGAVLTIIKEREKGLPVFLLGESMGGAIALRGAAAYGNAIAGVISSVPSAERFQQKTMSLTVAYHLLQGGKNKPFHVGDMVTNKATQNATMAEQWKSDAKAKMDMSPKELIKFAMFMRSTKAECEKITAPVFIIQGLKDKLVKPEGSEQLFDAVKGYDKNLLLVGEAEHLMFETTTPAKFLLDSLTTWMEDHSQVSKSDAK